MNNKIRYKGHKFKSLLAITFTLCLFFINASVSLAQISISDRYNLSNKELIKDFVKIDSTKITTSFKEHYYRLNHFDLEDYKPELLLKKCHIIIDTTTEEFVIKMYQNEENDIWRMSFNAFNTNTKLVAKYNNYLTNFLSFNSYQGVWLYGKWKESLPENKAEKVYVIPLTDAVKLGCFGFYKFGQVDSSKWGSVNIEVGLNESAFIEDIRVKKWVMSKFQSTLDSLQKMNLQLQQKLSTVEIKIEKIFVKRGYRLSHDSKVLTSVSFYLSGDDKNNIKGLDIYLGEVNLSTFDKDYLDELLYIPSKYIFLNNYDYAFLD